MTKPKQQNQTNKTLATSSHKNTPGFILKNEGQGGLFPKVNWCFIHKLGVYLATFFFIAISFNGIVLGQNRPCLTDDATAVSIGNNVISTDMYLKDEATKDKKCSDLIIPSVLCSDGKFLHNLTQIAVYKYCNSACKGTDIIKNGNCRDGFKDSATKIDCCTPMGGSDVCSSTITTNCCVEKSTCTPASSTTCTLPSGTTAPICPTPQTCQNACTEKEICDSTTGECSCDPTKGCCGVELNTDVPFIGKCIEMSTSNDTTSGGPNKSKVNILNAFPFLLGGLSKIMVTSILVMSFIAVIAGGVMMAGDGLFGSFGEGKKLVFKVITGLILLGASGIILRLINPNFFK